MSYQVTLKPSGKVLQANPDESLMQAAQRAGISLPYGCRNGLCGMCRAKLLDGRIESPTVAGLTEAERQDGYILCCQALPRSDIQIAIELLPANNQLTPQRLPARVEQIERLSYDVLHLTLKLPESTPLRFLSGQYVDFLLPDGRRRSFSLANAPRNDNRIEFHIRHVEGGRFTGELFDHLKLNDMLRIEGPLGAFFLRDNSARPVILLAGGTGFAPVKAMIEDVIARGIPRLIYIYWGARTRSDLYLHTLAESWAQRYSYIHYVPVLSDPKPEDRWTGRTGYVHLAVAEDFPDLSGYEVYGSGPPAMVYAGRDVFEKNGLPREHYFSDAFDFAND